MMDLRAQPAVHRHPPWRMAAARRRVTPHYRLGLPCLAICASLLLGYVLVRHSAKDALALALLPVLAWFISRRFVGVYIGVALVLCVPYWYTLGSAQLSVLRVSAAACLLGVFFARRPKLCLVDFALATFVVVTVLGWVLQYDYAHAGRVVGIELTPLGVYVGVRLVPPRHMRTVVLVALFAGTVGALSVLYERYHGAVIFSNPASYAWSASESAIFRPGGVWGSPPGACTVLCVVILFGLASLTFLRARWRKLAVVCVALCALAVVVTFTRAGLIAVGASTILYLALIRSPLLNPVRVTAFVATIVLVSAFALPQLETTATFQEGIIRPGNLSGRENYWSRAFPVATANVHNFVFGIGTAALETPTLSAAAPVPADVAVAPTLFQDSLHSQYMTTLVEQGAIGIAALLALLGVPFLATARLAWRRRNAIAAGLAASFVGMAIIMSVDTSLLEGSSFALLMVAAALAANLVTKEEPTGVEETTT